MTDLCRAAFFHLIAFALIGCFVSLASVSWVVAVTCVQTADKSHSDSASGGESDSDSGSEEESQASGSSKGRKKGLFGLFRGEAGCP